jgi:hypothetical protein
VPSVQGSNGGRTVDPGGGIITFERPFGVFGDSGNGVGVLGLSNFRGIRGSVFDGEGSPEGPGIGVEGFADRGVGVRGGSDTGTGVQGESQGGIGVRASSNTDLGVLSTSNSHNAIVGRSTASRGVVGQSESGDFELGAGVLG